MKQSQDERGRFEPLRLTEELATSLVEGVRRGLFDAQNANKHNVSVDTLKSWVDRGLDEEAEEPYRGFAERYIKESIALEELHIEKVCRAADDWLAEFESTEVESGGSGVYLDGCDSSDVDPAARRKLKRGNKQMRGDWHASAWYLERRWPLRWGITRQPEGGPKEALKLPEAGHSRRDKVKGMLREPTPELIKAFREAGFDIIKREDSTP